MASTSVRTIKAPRGQTADAVAHSLNLNVEDPAQHLRHLAREHGLSSCRGEGGVPLYDPSSARDAQADHNETCEQGQLPPQLRGKRKGSRGSGDAQKSTKKLIARTFEEACTPVGGVFPRFAQMSARQQADRICSTKGYLTSSGVALRFGRTDDERNKSAAFVTRLRHAGLQEVGRVSAITLYCPADVKAIVETLGPPSSGQPSIKMVLAERIASRCAATNSVTAADIAKRYGMSKYETAVFVTRLKRHGLAPAGKEGNTCIYMPSAVDELVAQLGGYTTVEAWPSYITSSS